MFAATRASLALALGFTLAGTPVVALARAAPEVQHPEGEAASPEAASPEAASPDEDPAEPESAELPVDEHAADREASESPAAVEEPGEPSASPDEPPTELPDIEPEPETVPVVPVAELEAEQRAAAAEEAEATPAPPPGGASFDADLDYDPVRDHPKMPAARRWLGAGIAATVTGAVLVGGAVALSQTAPCDPSAGNNCFTDARNRAAITMGVPGGVLLLGGIAMTTLGALQNQRIKASVALAPGSYGVALAGRF